MPAQCQVRRMAGEDWAESWKKHFRPLEVGAVLLIKPSWSRCRARLNQATVILDPGLSFGTGQHATTEFCLRQLVARRPLKQPQSFLDMGTGSGILAIAAAKLGYHPVHAFDFDPDAVRIAQDNARRNGVRARLTIRRQDLRDLGCRHAPRYHLICANLEVGLLLSEHRRILSRLHENGALVLSGILDHQFPRVQNRYLEAGLTLAAEELRQEWRSGVFVFSPP